MVPRENKNNAYAKFWGQTKSIMVFSEVVYNYKSHRFHSFVQRGFVSDLFKIVVLRNYIQRKQREMQFASTASSLPFGSLWVGCFVSLLTSIFTHFRNFLHSLSACYE